MRKKYTFFQVLPRPLRGYRRKHGCESQGVVRLHGRAIHRQDQTGRGDGVRGGGGESQRHKIFRGEETLGL